MDITILYPIYSSIVILRTAMKIRQHLICDINLLRKCMCCLSLKIYWMFYTCINILHEYEAQRYLMLLILQYLTN